MKEIKKIRIGNDIRLAVDLRQYIDKGYLRERQVYTPGAEDFESIDDDPWVNKKYEVYYPEQYTDEHGNKIEFKPMGTPIGIRNIKALLINTSREAEIADRLKKKARFVSRFPIEPFIDPYEPTQYDICNSGYPTWRAYPHRHAFMPYHGFGVHPEWDGIYTHIPFHNDTEYRAAAYATEKQNVVEVSFPARAQRYIGKYKLVIVAEVYAPGFNHKNLKTITVDMPDVFELVKTSQEGIDTGITMTVGDVIDILPGGEDNNSSVKLDDIYVNKGGLELGSNGKGDLNLGRTDGSTVTVDLSRITEWYDDTED